MSLVVASTLQRIGSSHEVLDLFTQGPPAPDPPAPDPPVPGSPAPTKGSEVVQAQDTAGLVAGWSIQSCSNCTINITLGK